MVAWYERKCQRAPQLARRAAMQRQIGGSTGSLRRWWSRTSTTRTYGNLSISLCCCSGKSHTRFHGTWMKRSTVGRKLIPPKQMLWCPEAWRILHGARTTLLSFLNPTDTIHRTFILNMPRPIVEMLEGKFKAGTITDLTNYSLAQLYQMVAELIQNHCRN